MRAAAPSMPIRRYDAQVLDVRRLEWPGGRAEVETLDVTGRRAFEVHQPGHVLTLPLDGAPRGLTRRFNGGRQERSTIAAGQVAFLPAGNGVTGFTEGVGLLRRLVVFLDPETTARYVDAPCSRLRLRETMNFPGLRVRRALTALAREATRPGPLGQSYAESLAASISAEVMREQAAPLRAGGLSSRSLRRVTDYIDTHLGDDLSLSALAGLTGLSLVHFAREFKRATGLSPHRYVLARRVERARALLLGEHDCSLTAVALAVGFSSQSHLTTAFGQAFGTTPAAYRREYLRRPIDLIGF